MITGTQQGYVNENNYVKLFPACPVHESHQLFSGNALPVTERESQIFKVCFKIYIIYIKNLHSVAAGQVMCQKTNTQQEQAVILVSGHKDCFRSKCFQNSESRRKNNYRQCEQFGQ